MRQQLIDEYMKILTGPGINWDLAMDEAYDRACKDMRTLDKHELRVYLQELKLGRGRKRARECGCECKCKGECVCECGLMRGVTSR